MSTATGPLGPLLRVVHGSPTEELAALAAVLTAVRSRASAPGQRPRTGRLGESAAHLLSPAASWRNGRG